jgi:hypothetical protein
MTTSCFRNVLPACVAAFGLLTSAIGCGSDAPSAVQAPRSTSPEPQWGSQQTDPPPERPSTKEGCDACHGLWSVHGIEDVETCICRTNDEGQDCIDGNECQGECLLAEDAEFHVMDQGDPPRGYYVGSCAGYDTTFGCFRHVPTDISGELPLTPEEAGPFVCAD